MDEGEAMNNVCSRCQHTNMVGALICENCGALLIVEQSSRTKKTRKFSPDEDTEPSAPVVQGTKTFEGSAKLSLLLGGSEERTVELLDGGEVTIGRADKHTSVQPTVNLNDMRAWEYGVSRLHIAIRRDGPDLYLLDLGSTNGTFLTGERLPAREKALLHHKDQVRLGRFEIEVSFADEQAGEVPDK
jgi:pSer/pThr/pTyr-binding forkhead associated (FHA) protein